MHNAPRFRQIGCSGFIFRRQLPWNVLRAICTTLEFKIVPERSLLS
jgi:hypothetical protein